MTFAKKKHRLARTLRVWLRRKAAPRLNEEGLSLIEVSVVAGIMMILALGFATMMTNVGNQQRSIETKGNITQLTNGVRGTASTPNSLQNSMLTTN